MLSEESWVSIKGKRYRKFQFNGGRYYVVFRSTNEADIFCAPPENSDSESLVGEDSQSFRRNAAFVRAFHEACEDVKGNKRTDLHITPEMGLGLSEGKGTKVSPKKRH